MQFNIKKIQPNLKKWAEDLNRYFSKGDIQMAKKHLKTCSTLQIIRERQVKTTIKYHLTQGRMIINQKKKIYKCWRGCEEKGAFLHCWWECKLVRPLWGTVQRLLKLKIELLYDPTIPLLGISRKYHTWKRHMYPNVPTALYTTAKSQKQPKCPSTGEWIKKMWYIYTMEYYLSIKRMK